MSLFKLDTPQSAIMNDSYNSHTFGGKSLGHGSGHSMLNSACNKQSGSMTPAAMGISTTSILFFVHIMEHFNPDSIVMACGCPVSVA